MHTLTGGCRCGNFKVTLTLSRLPVEFVARECGCSFCVSRNGRHVSDPAGQVEISIADESQWNKHRFGTSTCDFMICKRCDGYMGAVGDTPAGLKAVVSVWCLDTPDVFVKTAPSDFEGESVGDRLARRARNWTPATVKIGPQ